MKYSNTTLRELNAQYRSVLKKCFLLNASLLIGAVLATPAVAAETPFLAENDQVLSGTYTGYVNDSNTRAGVATVDYKTTGVSVADGTVFNGNVNNAATAGGALKLLNGVTIGNNVQFVGNQAVDPAWGGGAMYIKLANKDVESSDTSVTIGSNGLFDGNSANLGGAIALEYGDVTIGEGTTFSNNSAANGGAIAMWQDAGDRPNLQSSLTLNSVVFDANEATGVGGAIVVDKNAGDLVVNNGTFTGNTAGSEGGAIFNSANTEVKGGKFSGNSATSYFSGGGAIFNQATLTVEDGTVFENNTAYVGGAISDVYDGENVTTTIKGAEFNNNHAIWDGGALATYAKVDISDSVFSGNTAAVTAGGITGDASNSDGGGAIMVGGTSDVSLTNVQFIGNESAVRGGAVSARHGTNYSLDMDTVEFTNNKSGNFGGAVASVYQGVVNINNGQFSGNEAAKAGGAIYIGKDTNYGVVGGVTSTNHGILNLSGENVFTGNTAGEKGGAIYADEGATINLSGTNTFSENTAGGVANDIYNLGALNITGGTTTIGSGIDGTGSLNVSSGATLDIGTAKVVQDTITFDAGSTLKANLLNTTSYGSLEANTINGNGAALSLTVGSAGDYVIAKGTGADSFADATVADTNSLYDIVKTSSDADTLTYTASVKAAEDIANDAGVSTQTASVLSTLANASNDAASQIALNLQNELAAGNKDAVESAATDLAPTNTSTVHSVATTVHSQILGAVNNRLAAPSMGRSGGDLNAKFGPWVQGLYNKSKQDSSSATPGFRGYTQGVAFGLDTLINDVYTVGVGYAYNATDVKSGGRKTDVYGHNFFIYGEYQPNAWFVNGTVNYSTSDYKEQRAVTGVGIASKYDVDTWGGQVMTGYDMASGLTPKAGLRYLHIKQDSYTDTLGQNVKTDNTDLLTAVAGVNYAYDFVEKDYTLTPEVRLAATYDIVSDNADATVVMGTGSYTTSGKRLPRFGVEAGVGVTMNMFDALDVSLNYDAGIRRDYTSHTGTVKFKYNF